VIGSIVNFLYAPEDPERVIEKLASPETRIVSLTITEGGYYVKEASGEFDDRHPTSARPRPPDRPCGTFGYLAEAWTAAAPAACRRSR
jgi:mannitol 2-dehydrogenase